MPRRCRRTLAGAVSSMRRSSERGCTRRCRPRRPTSTRRCACRRLRRRRGRCRWCRCPAVEAVVGLLDAGEHAVVGGRARRRPDPFCHAASMSEMVTGSVSSMWRSSECGVLDVAHHVDRPVLDGVRAVDRDLEGCGVGGVAPPSMRVVGLLHAGETPSSAVERDRDRTVLPCRVDVGGASPGRCRRCGGPRSVASSMLPRHVDRPVLDGVVPSPETSNGAV